MKTIQELAQEYLQFFETKNGENGILTYTWKDGSPQELKDLIREAHGDMMPEDYKYAWVVDSLQIIADDRDEESIEADIYNRDLLNWLSSHLDRPGYCDQYAEEFGVDSNNFSIINVISGGQYMEKMEVYRSVLNSLEEILEEMEDDDEEESEDEDNSDDDE